VSLYYDKEGNPIDLNKWVNLFENMDYKIIKQETLENGVFVSTVWLGLDHSFREGGKPIIFETMAFPSDNLDTHNDMKRYYTLEEALEGHKAMVKKWKGE